MTIDFVIDACVAVKWLVAEEASDAAQTLLHASAYKMVAPDLIRYEVANALWKKARKDEITADEAYESMDDFMQLTQLQIVDSSALSDIALRMCIPMNHNAIYDFIYVAMAKRLNTRLVTADIKLYDRLKNTQYASHILLLNDYTTH